MNFEEYLCLVKRRLNKNYNIIDDAEELGVKINLYANSHFAIKTNFKNRISPFNRYEINEKYYVKHFNNIEKEDVLNFFEFLHILAKKESKKDSHLQKNIIGVMVCDCTDEVNKDYIKSLKYNKSYQFYFKGWSEVQFILVDLKIQNLFFNDAAKENIEMFIF